MKNIRTVALGALASLACALPAAASPSVTVALDEARPAAVTVDLADAPVRKLGIADVAPLRGATSNASIAGMASPGDVIFSPNRSDRLRQLPAPMQRSPIVPVPSDSQGGPLTDNPIILVPGSLPAPQADNPIILLPGIGAVPEPATWAMMILGFGLVGAALRRRRRQLAAA